MKFVEQGPGRTYSRHKTKLYTTNQYGSLAQLVEQRPEEPRVPSSSLGGATKEITSSKDGVISLVILFMPRTGSPRSGQFGAESEVKKSSDSYFSLRMNEGGRSRPMSGGLLFFRK